VKKQLANGGKKSTQANYPPFLIEITTTSEHVIRMLESVSKPVEVSAAPRWRITKLQFIIFKTIAMAVFVWVLADLQGWATKNSYKPENPADFKVGIIHGMLMPAAFPALVAGHDLPIYAPNNSGRNYKIGYILGINTCGTLFFAIAYWHPRGLKWKY
jgi:hypothetical protein